MDPGPVALLGGSFNPPHIGHLLVSLYVLEVTEASKLWWIPTRHHPFPKNRLLAPWQDRLAWCEAAVEGHSRLGVLPLEGERHGPSYTIDTVIELQARHPGQEFWWVVGTDVVPELVSWHRWAELRSLVTFVVVGRGAHDGPDPQGARTLRLPLPLVEVSSTWVRERLVAGEDVRPWLPAGVWRRMNVRP